MAYKYVLFDLDGTLTDSREGILNTLRYTLRQLDAEPPMSESLEHLIGPPIMDTFKNVFGFDENTTDRATKIFRQHLGEKGIYENKLYEGITSLLEKLKSREKKLIIATSKLQVQAITIAQYFDIFKFFDFIAGSHEDGTRNDKAEVISYALSEQGVKDREGVIMVGDRSHDIIGAKKNNLISIGVLYGYGTRKELSEAGADYIAENVKDLERQLVKMDL